MASYQEAAASKRQPQRGVLLSILQGYQLSEDFLSRSAQTRSDYARQIGIIERGFADFPLSALGDRRTRAEFLEWRDRLAQRSKRQADYAWTVLARVLSWALKRGLTTANPCERGGRLFRGTRAANREADEAAFLQSAPAHLHLALILALWTGQ